MRQNAHRIPLELGVPASKSGMGMGMIPRSPANRGWDPHPHPRTNRGWGWGWGSGVPCPAWDRDPGGDLMILVVLITLRVTLRVAAAAVVSGVHRTLPAFEN
jgi:hypothetical protein